jgi:hypothetical protein
VNGENGLLVTVEPVEFEKYPVQIQDFIGITNPFRIIFRIFPYFKEEIQKISTYNQLILEI